MNWKPYIFCLFLIDFLISPANTQQTKLTSPTGGSGAAAATNPFLSSPPGSQATNIVDLFGGTGDAPSGGQNAQSKASDDLLQLGNPFADMFGSPAPGQMGAGAAAAQPANNNMWMSNGKFVWFCFQPRCYKVIFFFLFS